MRILTEPRNALTLQYQAMLETEGVALTFAPEAIREIARIAAEVNDQMENIGARRLHTVLEALFEDISYRAPEMSGEQITIDGEKVRSILGPILASDDLSRYIL